MFNRPDDLNDVDEIDGDFASPSDGLSRELAEADRLSQRLNTVLKRLRSLRTNNGDESFTPEIAGDFVGPEVWGISEPIIKGRWKNSRKAR